jgi:hypothetical protein
MKQPKKPRQIKVALTPMELSVLVYTAGSVGDDLDSYGLRPAEKAAWSRAMGKLRTAGNAR